MLQINGRGEDAHWGIRHPSGAAELIEWLLNLSTGIGARLIANPLLHSWFRSQIIKHYLQASVRPSKADLASGRATKPNLT